MAELAEGARDWSLVNNHKARSLVVTGGRKIPKGFKKSTNGLREQARSFPYCTAGSPAIDNCYRRCQGWPGDMDGGITNCTSTQELFTVRQSAYRKCRQNAHSTQKDNCVKIEQGNDNLEDVINFDAERDGWYFHHTTEIEAPYGKFIQLEVKDFHIGNKTLSDSKVVGEDCGYGSIFIFSGAGVMTSMQKVIEFCGSTDEPVVDFKNLLYPGDTPETAVPVIIPNNRAIISITTQERFNTNTIGQAKATISWKIVDAPHSQLILQPEYFQHELVKKFRRAACIDLSDHIETEENDICTFTEGKRTQWLNRFNERFMSMMSDVFYKNHKNCFTGGDAFRFKENDITISRINAMQNMNDAFVVGKSYLQQVGPTCQFAIFWDARINKIRKKFENSLTNIPQCTMGSLCTIGDLS